MRNLTIIICFVFSILIPTNAFANKENDISFFINPISGPEEVYLELFLTNDSEKIRELETRTSQLYEIIVQNEKDEIVYQYSRGRFFLQALQKITLKPGETKTWIENLNEPEGQQKLKPGLYKVKAMLLASPLNFTSYKNFEDEAILVVPAENPVIKNVKVNKKGESYVITGKVKSTTGKLYYVVEDGHHEWIEENEIKVNVKQSKWEAFTFEINLPKNKYPDQFPLVLYLYEKDQSGNMIHTYPTLLK